MLHKEIIYSAIQMSHSYLDIDIILCFTFTSCISFSSNRVLISHSSFIASFRQDTQWCILRGGSIIIIIYFLSEYVIPRQRMCCLQCNFICWITLALTGRHTSQLHIVLQIILYLLFAVKVILKTNAYVLCVLYYK